MPGDVACLAREQEPHGAADIPAGSFDAEYRSAAAPFTLLRGKVSIHGATLIVDLEGSPFGSYVFTGQRRLD